MARGSPSLRSDAMAGSAKAARRACSEGACRSVCCEGLAGDKLGFDPMEPIQSFGQSVGWKRFRPRGIALADFLIRALSTKGAFKTYGAVEVGASHSDVSRLKGLG